MFVHVFRQHRFVKRMCETFEEAFPGKNMVFVISDGTPSSDLWDGCTRITPAEAQAIAARGFGRNVSLVCLHSIVAPQIDFGLRIIDRHRVLPFLWGGEYSSLLDDNPLAPFMPLTRTYVLDQRHLIPRVRLRLRECAPRAARLVERLAKRPRLARLQRELIERAGHFVSPIKQEAIDLIARRKLRAKCLPVPYGYHHHDERGISDVLSRDGIVVQLGHSGWPLNNHLDIIPILAAFGFPNLKVVAPLAYGDPRYISHIQRVARETLHKSFHAITDYVPKHTYFANLADVSCYIAPQRVQFGVGNVKQLISMGKHVFLPAEGPVYRQLIGDGFCVSSLDELVEGGREMLTGLDSKQRAANVARSRELWSRGVVLREIRESLRHAAM